MNLAFSALKLQRSEFIAINDNVIVEGMEFAERITQSGLVLLNDNGTSLGIRPRWGRVYAVGPNQVDVSVGEWVMVAHGRWTRGLDIEDETGPKTIRKVDPNDILVVSSDCPRDETMSTAVHVSKQEK